MKPKGYKCYLINLERATQRRERMVERLKHLDMSAELISGIDGRELSYPHPDFDSNSYRLLHGRGWSPEELGCYLSHIKAIQRFMHSDAEHALILEDDVTFEPNFLVDLDAALDNSRHWDVLRLSTVNSGRVIPFTRISNGAYLGIALSREKGAGAYMINRKAAKWLSSQRPMRLAYDILFDLEYLAGLKSAFLMPIPCNQNGEEVSQIQSNKHERKLPLWRYFTVFPYRIFLELSRVLLRGTRLLFAITSERLMQTREKHM